MLVIIMSSMKNHKTNHNYLKWKTTLEQETTTEESKAEEKRALPAIAVSILKNPKVSGFVVEKGIEVAGKLIDKQLKIIDEAQEKAEKFLKKKVKWTHLLLKFSIRPLVFTFFSNMSPALHQPLFAFISHP